MKQLHSTPSPETFLSGIALIQHISQINIMPKIQFFLMETGPLITDISFSYEQFKPKLL